MTKVQKIFIKEVAKIVTIIYGEQKIIISESLNYVKISESRKFDKIVEHQKLYTQPKFYS